MDMRNKKILDVTCGSRTIWFQKDCEAAVFMDKRECEFSGIWTSTKADSERKCIVKPDIVADFTNIPFKDESFSLVVFDPPHLDHGGDNAWLKKVTRSRKRLSRNRSRSTSRSASTARRLCAEDAQGDLNLRHRGGRRMRIVLDRGAYAPVRAHEQDAGLDLRTPIATVVEPHCGVVVDTGVHVELPQGTVGMIKSKSGLNCKKGIISEGVIDVGYTGSIRVRLYNTSNQPVSFEAGDKISQLVILPMLTPQIEVVEELEETERGCNGFGSSGR